MSKYKAEALKKRIPNEKYRNGFDQIDWKAKLKQKKNYEMDELSKRILSLN